MRAKEYIEENQSTIEYLDDINRVINDLLPLRKSKIATDEYYNRILMSDWRYEAFKMNMQDFKLNDPDGKEQGKPVLVTVENEIPHSIAVDFRNQLFDVIKDDRSFGYLFYQLAVEKNQKNAKFHFEPIQCVPDDIVIIETINRYKDDYPKKNLDEYLNDNLNYEHYCLLTENNIFPENETTLLQYFNTAYEIYDNVRCYKNRLSSAVRYCKQYKFMDDKQKFWILSFVTNLIDVFENENQQLSRCKNEIKKIINPIEKELYPQGLNSKNAEKDEIEQKTQKKVFTTAQQILLFYYLLNEIDINFGNTDKAQWVRFINTFTGKNSQDIKEKLNFNFDDKKTKRDLKIVSAYAEELIPQIAIRIKKDLQE